MNHEPHAEFRLVQSESTHYHVHLGANRVRGYDALKIDLGPQRGKFVLRGPIQSYKPMRRKEVLQTVQGLVSKG